MKTHLIRTDGTIIDGPDESTSIQVNPTTIPPPTLTSPRPQDVVLIGTQPFAGKGIPGLEVVCSEEADSPIWRSVGIVDSRGDWKGVHAIGLKNPTFLYLRHLDPPVWGNISQAYKLNVNIPSPGRDYPADGNPIYIGMLIKGTCLYGATIEIEVFSEANPTIVHRTESRILDVYGYQLWPEFPLTDNGKKHVLRIRQKLQGFTSDWTTSSHTFIL